MHVELSYERAVRKMMTLRIPLATAEFCKTLFPHAIQLDLIRGRTILTLGNFVRERFEILAHFVMKGSTLVEARRKLFTRLLCCPTIEGHG